MMTAAESQQFLRQQLSYAKLLLDRLGQEEAIPAKRAALQGALLGLNLGLSRYFTSLYSTPGAFSSTPGSVSMSLGQLASLNTYSEGGEQQEFNALMARGAWLRSFSDTVDSLAFLPKQWSGGSKLKASPQLIASTSASTNTYANTSTTDSDSAIHWTQLDKPVLLEWHKKAEELLARHTAASQEY